MSTLLSDCEQYESERSNQDIAREFYQTFGEDMATELVQQFKRQEAGRLRDRAESHLGFGVHDARLEQRVVGLDAKLERRIGQATVEHRDEMNTLRSQTRRWMLLVWLGTILPLVGVLLGAFMIG